MIAFLGYNGYMKMGKFGIDSERIIIAGSHGNLTITSTLKLKQLNKLHIISGFYPLCPYIAGEYPQKNNFHHMKKIMVFY